MSLELKSLIVRRLLARLQDANELQNGTEYYKGIVLGQIGAYVDLLNEYGCRVLLSQINNRYITATVDGASFPVI